MNTDTCPDCSNEVCNCGIPAGYTPRTNGLANRLIPIAENITATTAQTIITQVLIDVLTLTTKLETELIAVTEQRDRLAEALKDALYDLETSDGLMACDNEEGHSLFCLEQRSIPKARQALQSLNQAAVKGGSDE